MKFDFQNGKRCRQLSQGIYKVYLCPGGCYSLGDNAFAWLGLVGSCFHMFSHARKTREVVPCQGVLGVDFVAEDSAITLDETKEGFN